MDALFICIGKFCRAIHRFWRQTWRKNVEHVRKNSSRKIRGRSEIRKQHTSKSKMKITIQCKMRIATYLKIYIKQCHVSTIVIIDLAWGILSKLTICDIDGTKRALGMSTSLPPGPIFFICMQFLATILSNNKLAHLL